MKRRAGSGRAEPTGLNRAVLAALVLCGPALFWLSSSIDSAWPFRERDLVNGVTAVLVAAVCLILAVLVVAVRRHGAMMPFVNWGSATVLTLSAVYCAFFGVDFLDLGSTCRDPYCMYELIQIVWWILWAFAWLMVVLLLVIAAITRDDPRQDGRPMHGSGRANGVEGAE